MASKQLKVLLSGRVAGTLAQGGDGQLTFRYEERYEGTPLSTAMPISNRTYGDPVVRPFLFGVLPDEPARAEFLPPTCPTSSSKTSPRS